MNKSAKDIIRENMRPLLSKEENELIGIMEQYASQQVQGIADVANWHFEAIRQNAESQLAELTRQRDEAIRWAISFRSKGCPDPLQESFDWFMHTISQLENEKKDE